MLLVSATTFFGGGEVHYVKLASLLMERYDVAAIVCNGRLAEELTHLGIRVWLGNLSNQTSHRAKYWAVLRLLVHALRNYKPSVVHLNGGLEIFAARVVKYFGIPILVTYHTADTSRGMRGKRILVTGSLRCAQRVICISRAVQRNLQETFGIRHTTVIPNWLRPAARCASRILPSSDRPLALLYVGRIEREKGIFDLLEALKHLHGVRLDVVGDGPAKQKAIRESAGLPVIFHGFQADVAPYYQRADLLVLPSWSEGQSLVLIEAMASGLPCVISNLPAPMETAGDGRFALGFRAGEPNDLACAIQDSQHNLPAALARAKKAQEYAETTYSEARIRPMIFSVFDAALARPAETTSDAHR